MVSASVAGTREMARARFASLSCGRNFLLEYKWMAPLQHGQHIEDSLRRAYHQIPSRTDRFDDLLDHLLLAVAIEVDQHVPQKDDIEAGFGWRIEEVMLEKFRPIPKRGLHLKGLGLACRFEVPFSQRF